jgi:hypothetical protein
MRREDDPAFLKWYKRVSALKVSIGYGPSPWVDIDSRATKNRIVQCRLSAPSGSCSADGSIYLIRDLESGSIKRETTTWLRQQDVKKGTQIKLIHPDTNKAELWTIATVGRIRSLNKKGQALRN